MKSKFDNDTVTCVKILKKIQQLNGKDLQSADIFIDGQPLENFETILSNLQNEGYIKIKMSEHDIKFKFTLNEQAKLYLRDKQNIPLNE